MEISQETIPNLKEKQFSLIITDPPYYDDAPYAELSEFFFVWYQRILSGLYPNNPNFNSAVTPKEGDLSVSHLRTGVEFGEKFIFMCQKLNSLLKPNGMLVMFFAHPKVSTWNSVIRAFIEGNFHVTATWPVSTESKGIANAKKKNSLLSSLIIIARKVSEQTGSHKKEYTWEEFAAEAKKRVHEEFARLSKEGFRKADLITVALGICFELLTDPLHRNNIIDSDNAIKFIEALTEKEKMK